MAEKFKLTDLSGMVDKEFLLIVLGAEHERHVAAREIRRNEYTAEDYDSLNMAEGVLSEIIGRAKEYCEYKQLARIRNFSDGKGMRLSESINKSLEYYIFKIESIRIVTEDVVFLRGIASQYDYVNNAPLDEQHAEFQAYWPFPSENSITIKRPY